LHKDISLPIFLVKNRNKKKKKKKGKSPKFGPSGSWNANAYMLIPDAMVQK
jgi:hypothetical protein